MITHLKKHRTAAGLTQQRLATLTGVSRQTINAIENKTYAPSVELALHIAYILKVKVEDLFELEHTRPI